jgi:hypothetical protein
MLKKTIAFPGLVVLLIASQVAAQTLPVIGPGAFKSLDTRVAAVRKAFWVYQDQDSGFNHGFPSGFWGHISSISINAGCVDAQTPSGCSSSATALDKKRGTVLAFTFGAQPSGSFAGVNIEEPENWGVRRTGRGYDLRGATRVTFMARSPNGGSFQFSVGGCTSAFLPVPATWTTIAIPFDTLNCAPNLADVHLLLGVAVNDQTAPVASTILLDAVQFLPVPKVQKTALGFPAANQTFGVVPSQTATVPLDQLMRNLSPTYELSLAQLAFLKRRTAKDLIDARLLADSMHYALTHENHGIPLPSAPGAVALHNAYESGDAGLWNAQVSPKLGQAGDVRLAGFTSGLCAPGGGYCLVLDGATGGNNAFVMLAQLAAYREFGDARYLDDARTIGRWIRTFLTDTSGSGYGGYHLGYPDEGVPAPKPRINGKSVENNADIYAAFRAMATVEASLGNGAAAAEWTAAANIAGDFVIDMFDGVNGRFNVGTVPIGTPAAPGICPTGAQLGGEVINTCDFLDANTFTTLAMADAPGYRSQIDWRRPVQYAIDHFAQTVTAGSKSYSGFNLVTEAVSGTKGVAWEFTGQMVETMRYVDARYGESRFAALATMYLAEIRKAQTSAPFKDGAGLVASTLPNGANLPPAAQCLPTPFQCIAERVGMAATAWAIYAEVTQNPLVY